MSVTVKAFLESIAESNFWTFHVFEEAVFSPAQDPIRVDCIECTTYEKFPCFRQTMNRAFFSKSPRERFCIVYDAVCRRSMARGRISFSNTDAPYLPCHPSGHRGCQLKFAGIVAEVQILFANMLVDEGTCHDVEAALHSFNAEKGLNKLAMQGSQQQQQQQQQRTLRCLLLT